MITLNWPRNLQSITFVRCLLVFLYVSLSVFSACYRKIKFCDFCQAFVSYSLAIRNWSDNYTRVT